MNRPTTVPKMVPRPPKRLVPPMTTAAMTLRLVLDWPAIAVVQYCARDRMPADPGHRAGQGVDQISWRSTLTPTRRADSSLEPTA